MIYVVSEVDDGSVVKIGHTRTSGGRVEHRAVEVRLASLQVSTWRRLRCIAMAPGDESEERRLHWEFRASHVNGEWFTNTGPVQLWVSSLPVVAVVNKRRQRSFEVGQRVASMTQMSAITGNDNSYLYDHISVTVRKYLGKAL